MVISLISHLIFFHHLTFSDILSWRLKGMRQDSFFTFITLILPNPTYLCVIKWVLSHTIYHLSLTIYHLISSYFIKCEIRSEGIIFIICWDKIRLIDVPHPIFQKKSYFPQNTYKEIVYRNSYLSFKTKSRNETWKKFD